MTRTQASAAAYFRPTYAQARSHFLAAAQAAGLAVQSHAHPLAGIEGEALAIDVALAGAADATALLLVTSACHGVEGHCGSGVQVALLSDATFLAQAAAAGVALLFVHALNPHGFSWSRRVTHENVDLNRNWPDFGLPLPRNAAYDAIAHRLLPLRWPPGWANEAALLAFGLRHGRKALQQAVSGGQYMHPEGLFYGGREPTWSHRTLRAVLQAHASRCRRLGWIDLHTGLGPSGHGERIWAGRNDTAALARARSWWGGNVTSFYDGSSSASLLTGLMFNVVYEECAQADYTGIALEFGTVPLLAALAALRADQWHERHPEAPASARAAARQGMKDAFYIDTPAWQQQVLVQGVAVARQAVAGLAA